MLRRAWTQPALATQDTAVEFTFQTRQTPVLAPGDILWNILQKPPRALVDAGPFDCMIILSGIVPKQGADFALNSLIGAAGMNAAADLGIPRVLLASTSAVYGTYSNTPFDEDAPLDPVSAYGHSKRDMEVACRAQALANGIELCCMRIGNVAGADALLSGGVALKPNEKLPLDCFHDGSTPLRSYIGPHSLARVMVSLTRADTSLPATLNTAAPHPVTMQALAQAAEIPLELRPTQCNAHQHVTLDCTALTALHPFDPQESAPAEIVRQWRMLGDGQMH